MAALNPKPDELRSPVKVSFDSATGGVIVLLAKPDFGFVDRPVRFQGKVFQPKGELHISILVQEAAEKVKKYLDDHPDEAYEIREIVDQTRWLYQKLDTYYHIEEEPEVETIIQMVEMPGLPAFFKDLSGKLKQGFVLPPTHVTLYTRGTETGIALPSQEIFQQRVRSAIHPEEIQPEDDRPARLGADQGLA